MRIYYFLFTLFFFASAFAHAQVSASQTDHATKYWVYFTDKKDSPFSVTRPSEFLSAKAIARRLKYHIPIEENDLPVNPFYIQQIENLHINVDVRSRCLNAVSIIIQNTDQLAEISALPFVQSVVPVKSYYIDEEPSVPEQESFYRISSFDDDYYGATWNQFHMMNGDYLHRMGYTGQGMTIAVLDGGFSGVDENPAFQSYWDKNQIKGTYNFPDDTDFVFAFADHGTDVLSIMAGDIPGEFVGAAPDADYYLFRTEIVDSERIAEEDFWLEGAEAADSVGADMINSSLGYTTFDDSTEDHTYEDLDGNTTVVTRAADWAASKGILVCNSAGNEAQSEWHFISAPADGDSVFTVGAVQPDGAYASFSGVGPTADGRIKPNIACQGYLTSVITPDGNIVQGFGTSFSSPLMCGTVACFWQIFPEKNNWEIMQAVQASASQADSPDNLLGFGIPDFIKAYYSLQDIDVDAQEDLFSFFPNPADDFITILIYGKEDASAEISIYDIAGRKVLDETKSISGGEATAVTVSEMDLLAQGIYLLHITAGSVEETKKLMIR